MSELIDRQSLLDNLNRFAPEKYNALVNDLIMKEPAVQPEIIRCKDCKHKRVENMIWNCPFGLSGGEDFFCAYGAIGGGSGT